ncbi:MAG TPA: response regulator transcription factor [Chloroflexota bacterium]|nr:response regulator transcription factor [Chloroflexota bacterium]
MADDGATGARDPARTTRLLLVDDHEVVRAGLRTLLDLEADLDVAGEAASGEAAIAEARRLRPDVVLLDVVMEGLGGVEACRALRSLPHPPRVLMLTSYSDDDAVISSILAGASGYLLKNTSRAELLRAIRAVAAGQELIDPSVTGKVTRRLTQLARAPEPLPDPLSEREREVLALIARGCTNREIAERLVISEKTAGHHVSHILDKLGLSRRSEAAVYAVRKRLVALDDDE